MPGRTRIRSRPVKGVDQRSPTPAYALHSQRDRRNITNEGLIKAIEAIDQEYRQEAERREKAGKTLAPKDARGKSAEETAKALGVSPRTVERVRAIEHEETPQEIKDQVRSGDEQTKDKLCKGETMHLTSSSARMSSQTRR